MNSSLLSESEYSITAVGNDWKIAKVDAMLLWDTKKYAEAEIRMQNEKKNKLKSKEMSFLQKRLSGTDKKDTQKGFY